MVEPMCSLERLSLDCQHQSKRQKGKRLGILRRSTCPPFGKHTRRAFPFQVPDRHMNQRLKSCAEQRNDKRILNVMCHSFRTKDWWMLILERNKTGCCTNQKLQPDDRDLSIQTVPFLLSPDFATIFRDGFQKTGCNRDGICRDILNGEPKDVVQFGSP